MRFEMKERTHTYCGTNDLNLAKMPLLMQHILLLITFIGMINPRPDLTITLVLEFLSDRLCVLVKSKIITKSALLQAAKTIIDDGDEE
jgi:hypothetical protein